MTRDLTYAADRVPVEEENRILLEAMSYRLPDEEEEEQEAAAVVQVSVPDDRNRLPIYSVLRVYTHRWPKKVVSQLQSLEEVLTAHEFARTTTRDRDFGPPDHDVGICPDADAFVERVFRPVPEESAWCQRWRPEKVVISRLACVLRPSERGTRVSMATIKEAVDRGTVDTILTKDEFDRTCEDIVKRLRQTVRDCKKVSALIKTCLGMANILHQDVLAVLNNQPLVEHPRPQSPAVTDALGSIGKEEPATGPMVTLQTVSNSHYNAPKWMQRLSLLQRYGLKYYMRRLRRAASWYYWNLQYTGHLISSKSQRLLTDSEIDDSVSFVRKLHIIAKACGRRPFTDAAIEAMFPNMGTLVSAAEVRDNIANFDPCTPDEMQRLDWKTNPQQTMAKLHRIALTFRHARRPDIIKMYIESHRCDMKTGRRAIDVKRMLMERRTFKAWLRSCFSWVSLALFERRSTFSPSERSYISGLLKQDLGGRYCQDIESTFTGIMTTFGSNKGPEHLQGAFNRASRQERLWIMAVHYLTELQTNQHVASPRTAHQRAALAWIVKHKLADCASVRELGSGYFGVAFDGGNTLVMYSREDMGGLYVFSRDQHLDEIPVYFRCGVFRAAVQQECVGDKLQSLLASKKDKGTSSSNGRFVSRARNTFHTFMTEAVGSARTSEVLTSATPLSDRYGLLNSLQHRADASTDRFLTDVLVACGCNKNVPAIVAEALEAVKETDESLGFNCTTHDDWTAARAKVRAEADQFVSKVVAQLSESSRKRAFREAGDAQEQQEQQEPAGAETTPACPICFTDYTQDGGGDSKATLLCEAGGHTACKACYTRTVLHKMPCPICRGSINTSGPAHFKRRRYN